VQRCPRDPLDPQASATLRAISSLPGEGYHPSELQIWAAHLCSIDFVLLIRDHLRVLVTLLTPPNSPAVDTSQPHPPAAGATTAAAARCSNRNASDCATGSCSEADDGRGVASSPLHMMRVLTLEILGILGAMLQLQVDAFALESLRQEGLRGLLQLLAYPDILTALIRLVLSPEMRTALLVKPCPAGGFQAYSGLHMLQMALCNVRKVMMKAFSTLSFTEHRLWKGLQQNLARILNSEGNLPSLEALVLTALPNGAPHRRCTHGGHGSCARKLHPPACCSDDVQQAGVSATPCTVLVASCTTLAAQGERRSAAPIATVPAAHRSVRAVCACCGDACLTCIPNQQLTTSVRAPGLRGQW
jgi:hypothetical protein